MHQKFSFIGPRVGSVAKGSAETVWLSVSRNRQAPTQQSKQRCSTSRVCRRHAKIYPLLCLEHNSV